MLENFLYKVGSRENAEGSVSAEIRLLPECPIYSGHFPGMPITPGVCLVQIAQELVESAEGRQLYISESKDIKFLSIVSPIERPLVSYALALQEKDADREKWSVQVTAGDTLCAKMSLVFRPAL